jgi:hypothetical protein
MKYSLSEAKSQIKLIQPRLNIYLVSLLAFDSDEETRMDFRDNLGGLMLAVQTIRIDMASGEPQWVGSEDQDEPDWTPPNRRLVFKLLFIERFRRHPVLHLQSIIKPLTDRHPRNDYDVIEVYCAMESFHRIFAAAVGEGRDTLDLLERFSAFSEGGRG